MIREFEYPTLYQQLRIAIGAEGSQRSHITLRAQPQAYGSEPWYDFVEVVVEEDRDGRTVKAHYAAEVVCFVDLVRKKQENTCGGPASQEQVRGVRESKGGEYRDEEDEDDCSSSSDELFDAAPDDIVLEEESSMLAFVKFYVNALSNAERGNDQNYRWPDLANFHKSLPFSLVKEDPNQQARYGLIDTEQIQQGLWVQRDFQDPNRHWVLKMA